MLPNRHPLLSHRLTATALFAGLLAAAVLFSGCPKKDATTPASTASFAPAAGAPATTPAAPAVPALNHATLETDLGPIEIEFLPDAAPKAVENFRLLSQRGYYDGLIFHRIVKGFMIQGGDPEGTGRGGQSAWGGFFADEIEPASPLYQKGLGYKRGIVAMANSGANTNASQFFIMHQDYPLPPRYVIFGRVTRGIEIVDTMAALPTVRGMDGGMSKPVTPPVIKKITIKP